ncbi:MAG: hypothetical protein MZU95_13990 [Desulfomicrobium escambiense]|nr:hypothetical protein [Desulfomicrobium escambiense]
MVALWGQGKRPGTAGKPTTAEGSGSEPAPGGRMRPTGRPGHPGHRPAGPA